MIPDVVFDLIEGCIAEEVRGLLPHITMTDAVMIVTGPDTVILYAPDTFEVGE